MTILALILLIDAVLHGIVVYRYGTGDNNMPFAIFAVVDLVLAIAVFLAWPSASIALWATLILSVIGLIGLTVTFNKPQREKTLDRIIWAVDALIVLGALYLLFFARSAAPPAA